MFHDFTLFQHQMGVRGRLSFGSQGMWTNVEQLASQLGVQQLVSPAMCGDIGKGTQWMGSFLNATGRNVFFDRSAYCDVRYDLQLERSNMHQAKPESQVS